jgi:hypothetical protein
MLAGSMYSPDQASLFLFIPNFVSILASPLLGRSVEGTDNAVEGTDYAVKGADNTVKGTDYAVKGGAMRSIVDVRGRSIVWVAVASVIFITVRRTQVPPAITCT